MQILDILLAFCYEIRVMQGEITCESGWTINKLSATLSYLLEFDCKNQVFLSFVRRVLIYPLYRNYELACLVINDVK